MNMAKKTKSKKIDEIYTYSKIMIWAGVLGAAFGIILVIIYAIKTLFYS